jgi:hypothetical protein
MKHFVLGLAAVSLTAAALPAAAQTWGSGYSDYWQGRYGYRFQDYPEFRGEIAHIRAELREGANEGWLDDGQARQLSWRLRQVQIREAREFRYHGWNLPSDDRAQIRSDLDQLDHWVDQARDASGNYDGGWNRNE